VAIDPGPTEEHQLTRREQRTERASWSPTLGPGMALGILSTIGVILSMFMSWRTGAVRPSDIPVAFLFDSTTTAQSPSLLIALIPLAMILALGSLRPRASGARILGGLGTLVAVALFAVQLRYVAERTPGMTMWDLLDTGFYVAAIAAVVGLVSAFMPSGWERRRWSESQAAYPGETATSNGRAGIA
jgi:hypothetical protein